MTWDIFEEHWELAAAILGAIWGLLGGIGKRKADRKLQWFLETHFKLIEKYERDELAILNGKPTSEASTPKTD